MTNMAPGAHGRQIVAIPTNLPTTNHLVRVPTKINRRSTDYCGRRQYIHSAQHLPKIEPIHMALGTEFRMHAALGLSKISHSTLLLLCNFARASDLT